MRRPGGRNRKVNWQVFPDQWFAKQMSGRVSFWLGANRDVVDFARGARLSESSRTIVPAASLVTRFFVAAQSGANNPVRISLHNKACQTSGSKCAGIDVDSVRAEFRLFGWCMAVHDNLAEVELAVEKLITNP